ncbi:MAG: TetR/AcrR family transcriptional regulator [Alphaproteobacteria bacterium]|nr:TetR/AcrR family transcriptional regulator [Alphaproteobacteria bacterium]
MAQLAAEAGVSPATPYNLMGGRAEIVREVIEQDEARFIARISSSRGASPLAALLNAADAVVSHYSADPSFYRGLYRVESDNADLQNGMLDRGRALWRRLVSAAIESGELSASVRVGPLTELLLRIVVITTLAWIGGKWGSERFRMELAYGVSMLLAAAATVKTRNKLLKSIGAIEAKLDVLADSKSTKRKRIVKE